MYISSYDAPKPNGLADHLQIPLSAPRRTPSAALPTQMIIFPIKATASIEDPSTPDGQIWAQILDILEGWNGFRRLYWGRHVEEKEKTQIHIIRETLSQHTTFLSSPAWTHLTTILLPPLLCPVDSTTTTPSLIVRHALISDFTDHPQSLGAGAPVTGTAIYLATDKDGWEKTWALWTTLVPHVKGCLGCAGGWVVEDVDGHEKGAAYVVWVGWENTQLHDAYHYTRDFGGKRVILQQHNRGWREYGHVAFLHSRGKKGANL